MLEDRILVEISGENLQNEYKIKISEICCCLINQIFIFIKITKKEKNFEFYVKTLHSKIFTYLNN